MQIKIPPHDKRFYPGNAEEILFVGAHNYHTIIQFSMIKKSYWKTIRVGGIWPWAPTCPPHRVPKPLCILQIKQKRHCCLYTIPLSFFLLENITGNPPHSPRIWHNEPFHRKKKFIAIIFVICSRLSSCVTITIPTLLKCTTVSWWKMNFGSSWNFLKEELWLIL